MLELGVDLDGVLFDTMSPILRRYNSDYNDDMTLADITDFDFEKDRFKCGGKLAFNYFYDPRVQFEASVYPFAEKTLRELMDLDWVDVTFTTATARVSAPAKMARLETLFPSSEYSYGFFFSRNKTRLGCDLYIDDCLTQVMQMVGSGARVLLYDQPWNVWPPIEERDHWTERTAAIRVKSWFEIPKLVKDLEGWY